MKGFNPAELEATGTVRERVVFWKGVEPGDWLVGHLVGFTTRKFEGKDEPATIAIFEPCVVSGNGRWNNAREAQVILSAALAQRISRTADIGRVFAIRFDGMEKTDKNNDARLYTVFEQSAAKLEELLSTASA